MFIQNIMHLGSLLHSLSHVARTNNNNQYGYIQSWFARRLATNTCANIVAAHNLTAVNICMELLLQLERRLSVAILIVVVWSYTAAILLLFRFMSTSAHTILNIYD